MTDERKRRFEALECAIETLAFLAGRVPWDDVKQARWERCVGDVEVTQANLFAWLRATGAVITRTVTQ
jgi:hypothetical protein